MSFGEIALERCLAICFGIERRFLMEVRETDLKRMREIWKEFGAHYDRLHAF